eukprot:4424153-Amphidinium_carterae.1
MQVLRREVQDLADRVDLMPIPPVAVEIDGDEVFEVSIECTTTRLSLQRDLLSDLVTVLV